MAPRYTEAQRPLLLIYPLFKTSAGWGYKIPQQRRTLNWVASSIRTWERDTSETMLSLGIPSTLSLSVAEQFLQSWNKAFKYLLD